MCHTAERLAWKRIGSRTPPQTTGPRNAIRPRSALGLGIGAVGSAPQPTALASHARGHWFEPSRAQCRASLYSQRRHVRRNRSPAASPPPPGGETLAPQTASQPPPARQLRLAYGSAPPAGWTSWGGPLFGRRRWSTFRPALTLTFARYGLGWAFLLLAGYPFALAGHYDIFFGRVCPGARQSQALVTVSLASNRLPASGSCDGRSRCSLALACRVAWSAAPN
jgi:hypothetical protein